MLLTISYATGDVAGKEVSFVYTGEMGDRGFLDQAYLGLIHAQQEMNLTVRMIHIDETSPEPDPVTGNETIRKADVVVVMGSFMTGYAERVIEKYGSIPVLLIDADPDPVKNVKSATFSMNGASYLAGILAANQTRTGRIGIIAGMKNTAIDSFTDGFVEGAGQEDPGVEVNVTYVAEDSSGFSRPETAAGIAENMYRNGTDIIFTVAGGSGLGVISTAKELPGLSIIGVDSDQSYLGPGFVIASVVKNLEPVVYREVKEAVSDSFSPGVTVYNLENGGSSLVINPLFGNLSKVVDSRIDEAKMVEKKYALLHS